MKKNIFRYPAAVFFWILLSLPLYAEGDPNDPSADQDPPTPIDMWVYALFLLAAIVGVYYIIHRQRLFVKEAG